MNIKDAVQEIKYRMPIEEVVGQYVKLIPAGANKKALCPFHSEKTPSFTLYPDSFYCFGCGVGGDLITFIMKIENMDYIDAVKYLADKCGIVIDDNDEQKHGISRTKVIEMNSEAAKYFYGQYTDNTAGKPAREYVKKRGLKDSTVRHFGLGYAPNDFHALCKYMNGLGYSDEDLVKASLCRKNDKGYVYDFFRNRLMFPVIDISGNIIAFSGRRLNENDNPKYINSSESPAFQKKKTLYGLNFAQKACQSQLILCEGQMDVIAMHESGFTNSVATLGTALTDVHARMIKKITKNVVLAYDGDQAGIKATDRAIKELSEVGLRATVLVITGAKDPDEYIRKNGTEKFRKMIDSSESKTDFVIKTILNKYNLNDDGEKFQAAKEICEAGAGISSMVERDLFMSRAAKELGVNRSSLEYDLKHALTRRKNSDKREGHNELMKISSQVSNHANLQASGNIKSYNIEKILLGCLMNQQELRIYNFENKVLCKDDFKTDLSKKIFEIIDSSDDHEFDTSVFNIELNEAQMSEAIKIKVSRDGLTDLSIEDFKSLVNQLKDNNDGILSQKDVDSEMIKSLLDKRRNGNDKK